MSKENPLNVNINLESEKLINKLLFILLSIALLLFLLDATVNWGQLGGATRGIRRMFNITREDSIATFFSSLQFFFLGLMFFLCALCESNNSSVGIKKKFPLAVWKISGLLFVYIAFDDGAKIHERVGSAVGRSLRSSDESGVLAQMFRIYPSYDWQVLFLPVFILLGLGIFVFLWIKYLKTRKARLYLLIGFALLGFSQLLDFIEGMEGAYGFIHENFNWRKYTVSHFAKAIEETLEMIGTTYLLVSLVAYFLEKTNSLYFIPFKKR